MKKMVQDTICTLRRKFYHIGGCGVFYKYIEYINMIKVIKIKKSILK